MPSAKELRDICKELNIRGYSKMKKSDLTAAIEGHVKDRNTDENAKLTLKEPEEAQTVVRGSEVRKRGKPSTSPWVQFCREYSKENGISYKDAMSKKEEYGTWKSKRTEKSAKTETEAEPLLAE